MGQEGNPLFLDESHQFRLLVLERLNFPGFWTCDNKGTLVGEDSKFTYRFEEVAVSSSTFNIATFKQNKMSGRETRVSAYCGRNITDTALTTLKHSMFLSVVNGG